MSDHLHGTVTQGPRFRIVPGPHITDSGRGNAGVVRNSAAPSNAYMAQSAKQETITGQQMQIGSLQVRQPVQYVMMNQGGAPHVQPNQMNMSTARPANVEHASMVSKCARFFKTLIQLSRQPEQQQGQGQQTAMRVTELVKMVIYGSMPPEVFTSCLQEALRSQAQPHLLPFLQKTLPALRAALQKGEVVIEGIPPPPSQQAALQELQQPVNQTWDLNFSRVNTENSSYMPQRNEIVHQQPSTASNLQKTGTNDESSVFDSADVSSGDFELRSLPAGNYNTGFLNSDAIARKLQRAMPEGGPADEEAVAMIAKAAEGRLRTLLAALDVAAEHRMDSYRKHPHLETITENRRQLRFIEELEKREFERRENREKEALMRLSKSKGKDKDTLVEKAKQMQRADIEAARNRDANAAAIAALGNTRITKRPWCESTSALDQPINNGLTVFQRPRVKRVTMRDLQHVLASDPYYRNSTLRHRLALFNYASENS